MAEIEIDGKKINVEPGSMVIEAADQLGVDIPRFCYHKKLSIAANCRMCLVDVEKSPKPLPACATPVTEGMKVWTRSKKALEAQKAVMEFLLINHPLDCPICDQGGECELQDISMGYGNALSYFTEGKRVVKDKDIGPLISTDMTRCIHCTRCVRFGTEVAGIRELGATGRGEHMEIGTFIEHNVDSEVSGNVIDLCPVGALTSKPFRFTARGWELNQFHGIAPHDCVGSNILIHVRRNQVMRIVPKENEAINEVWISDRDRFSYEGLLSQDRLTHPKIKKNGHWHTVSWQEALDVTAKSLKDIVENQGVNELAAIFSPNSTVEEFYLGQKLFRSLGIHNLDHRLRQLDFRDQDKAPLYPNLGLGLTLSDIENQSVILLVGSNIRKEQPIISLKLRKMTLAGGKALAINVQDYPYNFDLAEKKIVTGGDLIFGLLGLVKAIAVIKKSSAVTALPGLSEIIPSETDKRMATLLIEGQKKAIFMGLDGHCHPDFSEIMALVTLISQMTDATVGVLSDGANSAGGWLAGFVPHRLPGGQSVNKSGFNLKSLWEKELKSYCLVGIEPELDCALGARALQALSKANFVVALTAYESETLKTVAHVLLPMTPFTENEGTYVNVEGLWQSFKGVVLPLEESRPAWKILRVMGNFLGLSDFEYEECGQIMTELKSVLKTTSGMGLGLGAAGSTPKNIMKPGLGTTSEPGPARGPAPTRDNIKGSEIIRLAPVPLYATDPLVRRARSLQKTKDAESPTVRLNAAMANKFNLKAGILAKLVYQGAQCLLPVVLDESVPDNSVVVPNGVKETIYLGDPYSAIEIYPA